MTKNEGRIYWQVPQITASDKEGSRRRSPPLIQEIKTGVRCTQKQYCKTVYASRKIKEKHKVQSHQDKREDHDKCQGIQ